jgi:colanic acid/amylovoran biosynthesis glycosyltransferase
MRIAMIADQFPAISEKFLLNQFTALLDRGIEIDLYVGTVNRPLKMHELAKKYDLLERTRFVDVPVNYMARVIHCIPRFFISLFKSPVKSFFAFRPRYTVTSRNLKNFFFLDAFRGKRYEIIHCQYGWNGLIGAFLKDQGIAKHVVVTFHGSDINVYPSRYGKDVFSHMFNVVDAVTVGSNFIKRKVIAYGCPESKVHVIPMGVYPGEYEMEDREREKPLLLSVGRLLKVKGHSYGLEAFKIVKQVVPDAEYAIIGEGPERRHLTAQAEKLGLSDSFRLLGELTDREVAEWYKKTSVFVFPSIIADDGAEEGQGLVLLEAQANRIPVVASRVGGIPEGMVDGVTGFLVSQKKPDELADKIITLLSNSSLRETMGKAGKDFVLKNYDMKNLAEQWVALYKELY